MRNANTKDNNFRKTKSYLLPLTSYLLFKKAQSILEYTILLGVIVMVLFVMGPMIKRSTQSLIKAVADQVGTQQNAEQKFDERGHMESSYMSARGSIDKQTFDTAGAISYVFNDVTTARSTTVSNLGYTQEQ